MLVEGFKIFGCFEGFQGSKCFEGFKGLERGLLRDSTPAWALLNLPLCYFQGIQGFREFRVFEGLQWFLGYTLVEGFNILDILKDFQGFKCFEGFKGLERGLLRDSTPALNLPLCYFSGFREFRVFEGFKWFRGQRLYRDSRYFVVLRVSRVSSV